MDFKECAAKLNMVRNAQQGEPAVVMGFDGFVDRIARKVVGSLEQGPQRLASMASMGAMLAARGEHSVSIELTDMEERVGGNMPITASALGNLEIGVDCYGAFGHGGLDPVFTKMPKACRLHSYATPGHCLALEFASCKLFLADNGEIEGADWQKVKRCVGAELKNSLANASLIGLFNWGELTSMQGIWREMAQDMLSTLPQTPRTVFFDPADCSRRTRDEMLLFVDTLKLYSRFCRVVLSVNDGEIIALARAMDIQGDDCISMGRLLYEKELADVIVLHSGRYAASWCDGGEYVLPTCYVEEPLILTGGGDCFNAGFALGLLAKCSIQQCLATGNTLSMCYVKNGNFPTWDIYMTELEKYNEKWEVQS